VDASRDAKPPAGTKSEIAGRLRSIAKIVIIDVAATAVEGQATSDADPQRSRAQKFR
jgi:hypothetical protein